MINNSRIQEYSTTHYDGGIHFEQTLPCLIFEFATTNCRADFMGTYPTIVMAYPNTSQLGLIFLLQRPKYILRNVHNYGAFGLGTNLYKFTHKHYVNRRSKEYEFMSLEIDNFHFPTSVYQYCDQSKVHLCNASLQSYCW